MQNIAEYHEKSGYQQTSEDLLAKAIVSMIDAMKADFGLVFAKQFPDAETLRQYKRRLYQRFRDVNLKDLMAGYEKFISGGNKFPPTVPELITEVSAAEKDRLRIQRNQQEAEQLMAIKPPTRTVNPLGMLADAIEKKVSDGSAIAQKLQMLESQINVDRARGVIRARPDVSGHMCEHGACNKAGTLSHSTSGGGNFYCATHFRQA